MQYHHFDPDILSYEDRIVMRSYVGATLDRPDLVIAPDGKPYIYRWYVTPRAGDIGDPRGNTYFHIQVQDDPERPLHDHPWDNMSVILAGGYDEMLNVDPPYGATVMHERRKGDVIFRRASQAHRLLMPPGVDYTMTQFTTGPNVKNWGFWINNEWVDSHSLIHDVDGVSTYTGPKQ